MSTPCAYRHPDGSFCKRWASKGSRFCHRHRAQNQPGVPETHDYVHPLVRLGSLDDIFNVVREVLNSARLGRISPGQTYAVGYMVDLWLRIYPRLSDENRQAALQNQMFVELLEEDQKTAPPSVAPPDPVPPDSSHAQDLAIGPFRASPKNRLIRDMLRSDQQKLGPSGSED